LHTKDHYIIVLQEIKLRGYTSKFYSTKYEYCPSHIRDTLPIKAIIKKDPMTKEIDYLGLSFCQKAKHIIKIHVFLSIVSST
jgi:hypothetical protein